MQRAGAGRHRAVVEDDAVALDAARMAPSHHVADLAQQGQLGLADHGAAAHGGRHRGVHPQEEAVGLEPGKQVIDRRGLRHGLQLKADAGKEVGQAIAPLVEAPVQPPPFARPDPLDGAGRHAPRKQPDAGVQRGLAGSDDHIPLGPVSHTRGVARGHAAHALCHLEGRRACGRYAPFEVAGVDQLAPHTHLLHLAAQARGDEVAPVPSDGVIAAGEVVNAPGRQEVLVHHLRVVRAQFVRTRRLVKTGTDAGQVHGVAPQGHGRHAVKGR